MEAHDWWHLFVLGTTLLAAAGAAVVLLAPVVFEEPAPGLQRAKPWLLGLLGAAGVLFLVEWLSVH